RDGADSSREATARGDRRVDGDSGARRPQDPLLLVGHAAAMRGNESFREQAGLGEILGRQDAALLLDGGHLAPDLIQVHRRDRVELGLELAEAGEKTGRAHIGRERRLTGEQTSVYSA